MNFKERLLRAKAGDKEARQYIYEMYIPLLAKAAMVEKRFDEDLFQELCETLLHCIDVFRIEA